MTTADSTPVAKLADLLGSALPEQWRDAFAATPRALFVPRRAWQVRDTGALAEIDQDADPEAWVRAVYSDIPIITQVDDGAEDGDGRSSSSCSMPSVVFTMLDQLDVSPGTRVLEIGTGTGWNAALLADRLGAENVVSIEIDLDTVPYSWVEQTRPDGLIVVPWGPPMANSHLVRFEVGAGSATGTIVESANFMRLRSQRWKVTDEPDDFEQIAVASRTDLDPRTVLGNHAKLAVALHLGECRAIFDQHADGETLWLLAADSWASVSGGEVRQAGTRALWDEAEDAYRWWLEQGSPVRPRFHITVTAERQWVWLDSPENEVPREIDTTPKRRRVPPMG
ncbi:rRNA adenine N-6-methyltransferase family protein [Amycolatopsis anabasis]|uniref:rRNA adenine N-6-methyltransferase family protein n=1 Tax=Amycolatopsis anabasis TaxID=1840409 RepID=UPI001C556805|nr:rRNA adenine N-6-methyltransferase family protein [Amycolatopsis anabasis]